MLVESEMELNPFGKSAYLFCSGSRKILKVIVWDGNGFWEMTKRLEKRLYGHGRHPEVHYYEGEDHISSSAGQNIHYQRLLDFFTKSLIKPLSR